MGENGKNENFFEKCWNRYTTHENNKHTLKSAPDENTENENIDIIRVWPTSQPTRRMKMIHYSPSSPLMISENDLLNFYIKHAEAKLFVGKFYTYITH